MFLQVPWQRAPILAPATCPNCAHDVSVWVAQAYRRAGARREHVGDVCDCVRCGARYTAMHAGGVVAARGAGAAHAGIARAGTDSLAGGPGTTGGAGDRGGASLIADMVTDFTRD